MSRRVLNGSHKQLRAYVRHMADLMGLRDYTITVGRDEPDSDDALADCNVAFGQKHVTIRYRKGWAERSPDTIRWVTVHELVHCHLWSMDQRMCDLHDLLGEAVYSVVSKAHREALEHAVDGIAREWAEHLPLPIKEKKE